MKGKRTILFNALMAIVAIVGVESKIDDEMIRRLIEAVVLIWTSGAIILRTITSSPIWRKL